LNRFLRAQDVLLRSHGTPELQLVPDVARNPGDVGGIGETGILFARSRSEPVDHSVIRKNRLLLPGVVGSEAHSFKMLRTQVLQRMAQHNWNTLAIVSPTPGDGKTFTAANLAIAISGDTKFTALLVDLDLRRPTLHRRFGIDCSVGVECCLRGEAAISDVLVNPSGYQRLLLLPACEPVANSSELLSSDLASGLIKEIKDRYQNRIVVFDLPPVLGADDALAFVPQIDAALVVIREGGTRSEDLLRLFEVLKNTPIIGTVLNGMPKDRTRAYAY